MRRSTLPTVFTSFVLLALSDAFVVLPLWHSTTTRCGRILIAPPLSVVQPATMTTTSTVTCRRTSSSSLHMGLRKNDKYMKNPESFIASIFLAFAILTNVATTPPPAHAAVAPLGDVGLREFLVKDGREWLRLGLPTSLPASSDPSKTGDVGRVAQESIELVRLRLEQVGFSGKTPVWNAALKDANAAKTAVSSPEMLAGIKGAANRKQAEVWVEEAKVSLDQLTVAVRNQDIDKTLKLQEEVGATVGRVRALSLPPKTLPYKVPSEYADYPQLRGRATVKCVLAKPQGTKPFVVGLAKDGSKTATSTERDTVELILELDGYHAPLTAGNFMDLVQRKFYDGMPIRTVGDLVVETGGGLDKKKTTTVANRRLLPLELFYKRDTEPTYGYTSDEDRRATESFVTPFQAYGALGMEYDPDDAENGVNGATTEFFFLKWDQALVPPSRNTLDGSHSCFGYVTDGEDLLSQVKVGDIVKSMEIVRGAENLVVSN